ncbi:serine hydrolase domain-containing protein [Streptomyces sp. SGAir0957]
MQVARRRPPVRLVLAPLAAVAVLAASAGPGGAVEQRHSSALARQVEAIHDTGVVGVAAETVAPDTRTGARAGTAVRGTGRPVPARGRFRIGSATKTFTATVVLQLAGEGRLSLADTVERWLPGVIRTSTHSPDRRRVTVRDLLQHTSGIPDLPRIPALSSADGYRAERLRTYRPEQLVKMALREPSAPQARPAWSYSNTNYVLAAMIIRRVTGRSWAAEVEERIIRPLGLTDTSAPGTFPLVLGPHAHGYTAFGAGNELDVTVLDPSMAVGSGALISTVHDLDEFYRALLTGRLLKPAQLRAMTSTVPAAELGPNLRYGLGLAEIPLSCGGTYFGHRGELLGYRTWTGATRDGARAASVYVTSDGGPDTEEAMLSLVDQHLCDADAQRLGGSARGRGRGGSGQ